MPGKSDGLFQIINNSILILISMAMIAPLIHLLALSLSSEFYASSKLVYLWPKDLQFAVYEEIFKTNRLWRSMGVSIYITIVGTLITLILSASLAFSLSRQQMKFRKWILKGIVITFIFTAPLIPSYLVVVSLGMGNTLWSLMIPGATGAFYVIIMKSFFQGISLELFDAAKIDGCTEFGLFYRVVIPLSKAVLATIGLFQAVGIWNSYFGALLFIRTPNLKPLQLILRELVVEQDLSKLLQRVEVTTTPQMMKAGIIIFATVPIILVYPFLQKYFVKGAMLGSLKE